MMSHLNTVPKTNVSKDNCNFSVDQQMPHIRSAVATCSFTFASLKYMQGCAHSQ